MWAGRKLVWFHGFWADRLVEGLENGMFGEGETSVVVEGVGNNEKGEKRVWEVWVVQLMGFVFVCRACFHCFGERSRKRSRNWVWLLPIEETSEW